jgi:hypothetical protein
MMMAIESVLAYTLENGKCRTMEGKNTRVILELDFQLFILESIRETLV